MNYFTRQLDLRRVLWRKSGSDDEIWICHDKGCLDNGSHSPDRRFRLGVNLKNGKAHCFNCGWKSGNKKYTFSAISKLFAIDIQNLLVPDDEPEEEEKEEKVFEFPSDFVLFGDGSDLDDEFGKEAWDYLVKKRNVSPKQIRAKRIGYAITGRYSERIIFPMWNEHSKLLGLVARSYVGDEPKYLNSKGLDRTFYNAHLLDKLWKKYQYQYVVIAEGIFDVLSIERAGYKCLGSLGAEITEKQETLLDGLNRIILFSDADEPGIVAACKNADMISMPGRLVFIAYSKNPKQKDAGDMPEDEVRMTLAQKIMADMHYRIHLKAMFAKSRLV